MKLHKRRKGKRILPLRVKERLKQATTVNQVWSMDFMSDSISNTGRKFRTFNVIDDISREALALEIDTSISSHRVIRTLNRIVERQGKPLRIRVDNGYISSVYLMGRRTRNTDTIHTAGNAQRMERKIASVSRVYRAPKSR